MNRDKVTGRPESGPNPLEPARQTTIISPQAPAGTPGTGGPPNQGLLKLLDQAQGLDYRVFYLVNRLTDGQVRQAAADYFPEALTYLRATGQMMTRNAGHFSRLNYTGADLGTRTDRIETISELVMRLGALTALLKDTLLVEVSDAIAMADTAVELVEMESKMPGMSAGERQNLTSMSVVPMGIWRDRVAGIQQSKGQGERDRSAVQDTVNQAVGSAVAERVLGKIKNGERPSDADILFAAQYLGQEPPTAAPVEAGPAKPKKPPKAPGGTVGVPVAQGTGGTAGRRGTKR